MYDDVLVPTDGSEGSDRAVERAIDLATQYDAALHALYVVEEGALGSQSAPAVLGALEDAGEDAVEAVVERADETGVGTVEASVARGVPAQAILEYVHDPGADVVVMGTHGRSGIDRYLLGSVTEKVVRHADVPVLTVPLAEDGEE